MTGSTNADVAVAGTVLVAEAQTAGRGGSGGPWRRRRVPGGRLSWLPLLTGVAVVRRCTPRPDQ
ncbi:MAG TPA: hypothetical protein VE465_19975 [Streptosporangiaceae bacterium]|nr:hypothetical protein [Streptosporangiaceae bacterium]